MLRRLRHKAPLPALISEGTRDISGFALNSIFANGGQGLKTRKSYLISLSKRTPFAVQWVMLHTAKQSLEFPRQAIDAVREFKTSLPSITEADDDFIELGPSVSGGSDSDSFFPKKKSKAPKTSLRQDSPVKPSVTRFLIEQDKSCPGTHSDLEGQSGALRNETKTQKQKFFANNNQKRLSPFISIDNIPPNISTLELREAISAYGEILSSSMRAGEGGLASCHFKFKSLEAKTRALAARWIALKNTRLPIRNLLYSLDYISIRIANISMEMTEVAIHSICTSYGYVFGLARTKEGAADVVFRVKDIAVSQSILKQLNDVVVDDRRWSAKLLTKLDQVQATNASDSQWPLGSQINSHLGSFRSQLNMQRIFLEDLENLHHAVLHLRDSPPDL